MQPASRRGRLEPLTQSSGCWSLGWLRCHLEHQGRTATGEQAPALEGRHPVKTERWKAGAEAPPLQRSSLDSEGRGAVACGGASWRREVPRGALAPLCEDRNWSWVQRPRLAGEACLPLMETPTPRCFSEARRVQAPPNSQTRAASVSPSLARSCPPSTPPPPPSRLSFPSRTRLGTTWGWGKNPAKVWPSRPSACQAAFRSQVTATRGPETAPRAAKGLGSHEAPPLPYGATLGQLPPSLCPTPAPRRGRWQQLGHKLPRGWKDLGPVQHSPRTPESVLNVRPRSVSDSRGPLCASNLLVTLGKACLAGHNARGC